MVEIWKKVWFEGRSRNAIIIIIIIIKTFSDSFVNTLWSTLGW